MNTPYKWICIVHPDNSSKRVRKMHMSTMDNYSTRYLYDSISGGALGTIELYYDKVNSNYVDDYLTIIKVKNNINCDDFVSVRI